MDDSRRSFCMVTTFYPPYNFGGDGIYVYRLAHALGDRGHRVTVVHDVDAYNVLGGGEPSAGYAEHPNVTVHALKSPFGPLSPLSTYLTGSPALHATALRRIFREDRFDVVHFHNVSLIGGTRIFRLGTGIKLYSAHEYWLICPMHVLWRYRRELCPEPDCVRCSLTFRRPPQPWRHAVANGRELKAVHTYLAPSRFSVEMHRRRGFSRPMRHLPYFVPPAAAEQVPAVEAERPYFLFVGRLEQIKGVQTLIELFRVYDAADLVIAGDGTAAADLRRQAAGLQHVRFLGHVPFTQLRALYAGAVAVLVPSIWYEVFGIVTLEAFAQRTPVIARDIGGLAESILDSGGGLVYSSEDQLLKAMDAVMSDPNLRRELGERGHDGFRRLWSEEAHLGQYLEIIAQVARRNGR